MPVAKAWKFLKSSLPLQIVIAVAIGICLGTVFPSGELKSFSDIGRMIIHWVKLIAGPFLFLTIVASIVEVRLSASHAIRLVSIALLNTSIAICIGVGLASVFLKDVRFDGVMNTTPPPPPDLSIGFASWMKTLMPNSLFSPFVQNEILLIGLMGLLTGIALRSAFAAEGAERLGSIARSFERVRAVPGIFLNWLIHLIPLAVLAVVAGAVSQYGLGIFSTLLRYVWVVLLGFALQIILVYGTWVFAIARIVPKKFFRETKAAISYAFGTNSSLATLPLTLKALKNLGVSNRSASLGAGVATNLNNDGIVLYEAMAVFFIAQLAGIPLDANQMIVAALACIVASMGITGIPEAGFISLSVVVATLGLPAEMLPLLLAVDWMVARGRSVVNVLSDMTLSIAMDATETKAEARTASVQN